MGHSFWFTIETPRELFKKTSMSQSGPFKSGSVGAELRHGYSESFQDES